MTSFGSIAVVIPAYRPQRGLVGLVESLAEYGFGPIVIIDDGSGAGFSEVIQAVEEISSSVTIARHARNLGKGAALKTGINQVCISSPDITGIVTLDADGQHAVPDVVTVAEALLCNLEARFWGRVTLGQACRCAAGWETT